jgi:hypothetical protein
MLLAGFYLTTQLLRITRGWEEEGLVTTVMATWKLWG